jgi:hypothetical protein
MPSGPDTIRCDTKGCAWRVTVWQDISEEQAALIVAVLGGSTRTAERAYHTCPNCQPKELTCTASF